MMMIDLNFGKEWSELYNSIVQEIHSSENDVVKLPKPFSKYTVATGFNSYSAFNKLIINDKQELEFSWDSCPEVTRKMLDLVNSGESSFPEKELIMKDKYIAGMPDFTVKHCEEMISSVFSPEFSHKILTEGGGLLKYCNSMLNARGEKVKGPYSRTSPAIRLEEEVNDYTILLMIMPDDYSMKLNFRLNKKDFPDNILTAYYRDYYHPIQFNKDEKKHEFRFFEHLGYETYPENKKNVNTFDTLFNLHKGETDLVEWVIKSGRSQMAFLRSIIPYLIIFCGSDKHNKTLLDPVEEIVKQELLSEKNVLKFYDIFRLFCLPHYDIAINAGLDPVTLGEVECIFSSIHAAVFPHADNVPNRKTAYLHPLVYEAGK